MKVLVTGSTGGIGLALVENYLTHHFEVFAHCRKANDKIKQLKEKHHAKLTIVESELKSAADIQKVWAQTAGVTHLVNSLGGIVGVSPVEALTPAEIEETFFINLFAPIYFCQAAARQWKGDKIPGRITNLSSIGVKFSGGSSSVHYSAAKSALESFGKSMARDWAKDNLTVTTVRVGFTDTDFHKKVGRTDNTSRIEKIPVRRAATAQEVAGFIFSMNTYKSDFITGSVVDFAGGE